MAEKNMNATGSETGTGTGTETGMEAGSGQRKKKSSPAAISDLGVVLGWDTYPELVQLNFGQLVERRTQLKDEIEFRKRKMDDLDQEIQALLAVAGTEKVTWEDRPVQIVHSKSGDKISAQKLLLAGVPAQTIADATEQGKAYSYLLVGKVSKQA